MDIWLPLLTALEVTHPQFPSILISVIINALCPRGTGPTGDSEEKKELSYELCLAAWAAFVVLRWDADASSEAAETNIPIWREEVLAELLTAIGSRSDGVGPAHSQG